MENLPQISYEQQTIINLLNNNNVMIDSVAGSGKTTTTLFIANTYCEEKILLLTYNAKLKIETRDKIKNLNLTNIEAHSYHSFCVKYYDHLCFEDLKIKKNIKKNTAPLKQINYDIIILDEAQDITPLYYELICKINSDNLKIAKYCVFGDVYQSIYDFLDSDYRYLKYADKVFNFNELEWKKTKLSTSYRITNTMANFVNSCMLNRERLFAIKNTEHKPRYLICDVFEEGIRSLIFKEVMYYLNKGYTYNDIFILVPSIKSNKSPVKKLENTIKNKTTIPVFVPVSDEEKLDETILKNKLVFSTYHQAKGLERKVVIVYNFDASYFKFFKIDKDPNICCNELYVAATRAKEHLTLIRHYKEKNLNFIIDTEIKKYCDIIGTEQIVSENNLPSKNKDTGVTDLTRHMPTELLERCINVLKPTIITPESIKIDINTKITQKDGDESVSEITGIAIPAYYEFLNTGKMGIYEKRKRDIENKVEKYKNENFNLENIDFNNLTPQNILKIANVYISSKTKYIGKVFQIQEYNWLKKQDLINCVDGIKNILNLSNKAKYEKHIEIENKDELLNRKIIGYIDCVDGKNIYEFKCVKKLETEHFVQLAIYAYIYETIRRKKENVVLILNYYLYNILTGELKKICCNYEDLKIMIADIIDTKYNDKLQTTTEEFLEKTLKIFKKQQNVKLIIKNSVHDKTQYSDGKKCYAKYKNLKNTLIVKCPFCNVADYCESKKHNNLIKCHKFFNELENNLFKNEKCMKNIDKSSEFLFTETFLKILQYFNSQNSQMINDTQNYEYASFNEYKWFKHKTTETIKKYKYTGIVNVFENKFFNTLNILDENFLFPIKNGKELFIKNIEEAFMITRDNYVKLKFGMYKCKINGDINTKLITISSNNIYTNYELEYILNNSNNTIEMINDNFNFLSYEDNDLRSGKSLFENSINYLLNLHLNNANEECKEFLKYLICYIPRILGLCNIKYIYEKNEEYIIPEDHELLTFDMIEKYCNPYHLKMQVIDKKQPYITLYSRLHPFLISYTNIKNTLMLIKKDLNIVKISDYGEIMLKNNDIVEEWKLIESKNITHEKDEVMHCCYSYKLN